MKTKCWKKENLAEAVYAIQNGQLVAFPTETVYGLGADAKNEQAVKQVYQAKGRPSDNPLIVHVSSIQEVAEFVETLPEEFYRLAKRFWPGPLTIILPIRSNSLSKSVTGGLETCAFRMPDHPLTLSLIKQSQTVLVGPSANTSGKPSPTCAAHVFHDLNGNISGILDGGTTKIGVESTVIDLSDPKKPFVLRPGAITVKDLQETLQKEVFLDGHLVKKEETPKAPGMKYTHYSPNATVYRMPLTSTEKEWQKAMAHFSTLEPVGILASDDIISILKPSVSFSLGKKGDMNAYNHALFSGLRQLDEHVSIILAETIENKEEGMAYMNRLQKASGNRWYTD